MATEQKLQDSANAIQLAYQDGALPNGYQEKGRYLDPASGAYAIIGQNTNGEVIVAFRGTEDFRDFNADIQLGIPQYDYLKPRVQLALDTLNNESSITRVDFVGHSLGGVLAQYAAYDYANSGVAGQEVGLFTYNGLGGIEGIKQMSNGIYDPTIAARIDAYNLWAMGQDNFGDFVSRLTEHVGGNQRLYYVGGNDPIEIHSVQNLQFYQKPKVPESNYLCRLS